MTTGQSPQRRPTPAASTLPLLGLVMHFRDEQAILESTLENVRELVDTWVAVDTGSTDDSAALALRMLHVLPGELFRRPWQGYGPSKTDALALARGRARWLLHLDADMTVWANDDFREWLAGDPDPELDAWQVLVHELGVEWRLPLLVRGDREFRYVGAWHEYLDLPADAGRPLVSRPLDGLAVEHHGEGRSSPEKLQASLALLADELAAGDPRATFYSAEALRFLGREREAIVLYERRARMGGWAEEAWYAAYQAARLRESVGALLLAWQLRPWRHEPLSAAARLVDGDRAPEADVLFREAIR